MIAAPVVVNEKGVTQGVRPFNIRKDSSRVLSLLRLAFGPALDAEGRQSLDQNFAAAQMLWPNFALRSRDRVMPGLVWEEDGEIIGNVSLLRARPPGRFLVANVAVHPHRRRRGIARTLMEAVLEAVKSYQGRIVLLQVKHDNESAMNLYRSLGFLKVGDVTTWHASYSGVRRLPPHPGQDEFVYTEAGGQDRVGHFRLRPLRGNEWRQAFQLDQTTVAPDLDWPQPLKAEAYRGGTLRWLRNLLGARQIESWTVADKDNWQLLAVASIRSEWGRPHMLRLRVRPDMAGQLERPLLAKLLRRLDYLANRRVRLDHPAADQVTNELMREANFRALRTLTVMRYDL